MDERQKLQSDLKRYRTLRDLIHDEPAMATLEELIRDRCARSRAGPIKRSWPPSLSGARQHTKWNHKQTIAYFPRDKAGRRLEEVMQLGDPDMYSAGNPLQATTTTLKGAAGLPPTGALCATKVNYGVLE